MVTVERVKELLHYDPDTGVFKWRTQVARNVRAGDVAGHKNRRGYIMIGIDGGQYLAHRLAWLCVTGNWPTFQIDHKHGNGLDNRWSELRPATRSFNMQNQRNAQRGNKSGMLGVTKVGYGFIARIVFNKKIKHLGTFNTPAEAHEVYLNEKRKLHQGCTI